MAQEWSPAQPPTITNQPASRAVWVGCSVSFTVGASGAGPFTYQWQLNATNLPNNVITTVAGTGQDRSLGDGGAATNAGFTPAAVAVDAAGDLLIADTAGSRIRKVGIDGIITTMAGGGTNGLGDGGPATKARLSDPQGVVSDASGNMVIADTYYHRIRKVDRNGIITTVAGNGGIGYSGDGGPATNATLFYPFAVAVEASGSLFIADSENYRVRKVDTNGIITTVAGNGTDGFTGDGGPATNADLLSPAGVALDASGNLFISDNNAYVRKVDTNGIITTVAGNGFQGFSGDGGPATNAMLFNPTGLAVDSWGNLLIADTYSDRIRKVDTNGIITTVAGSRAKGYSGDGGAATNAGLDYPAGVGLDSSGDLFIADDNVSQRIRKVTNTQGPTLALNNAMPGNAGNYQVLVTGPGGSVASSVATLTVTTTPLIYGTIVNSDGSLKLSFVSRPDSTNVVLSTTNLGPPILWQALATNVAGGDGDWEYTDTNAASWQARFYRSVTQ